MDQLTYLQTELKKLSSPAKAKASAWFFKTGPGQYGEGDVFLGITVPEQRRVAKKFIRLSLADIQKLIKNAIHEYRFTALEILVMQYEKGDVKVKEQMYNFYLKNTNCVNNWDLVDTSAPYIVGNYLQFHTNTQKCKSVLTRLAKSKDIWERRIAIVSTYEFIKNQKFNHTLTISKTLLSDTHDLIHKAVGWMLREVGKRDRKALQTFLDAHAQHMPRTALRYAIEHFPENLRKKYLLLKKSPL